MRFMSCGNGGFGIEGAGSGIEWRSFVGSDVFVFGDGAREGVIECLVGGWDGYGGYDG